jgi:alpha-1,4-digalacturonate transport system substrate-binding protein
MPVGSSHRLQEHEGDKLARLVEFLGGADAMSEYASKAMFLPTRKDLVRQGVTYPARNEDMNVFVKGVGQLPQSAYVDNYNLHFGQVANEARDRVTQVITAI